MRAYMESGFYVIYFVVILAVGVCLCLKSKQKKPWVLFGLACCILGAGDAFHLVPRAIGLFNGTLENPDPNLALWLGVGKLITSITMTAFYLLLYFFVYARAKESRNKAVDYFVYALVLARVVLCALPQNEWTTNGSPLLFGILRNVPFTILGILVIVLCYQKLRQIKSFKLLWIAIILSFGFYLPVVFFASSYSWVGMLMLPKTICYMWIGIMALLDAKSNWIEYQEQ